MAVRTWPYVQAKKISYGGWRSSNDIKYIVIHNTGNRNDTAKGNASYFHRTGDGNTRNAGAHFFIDQNGKIYQTLKLGMVGWSVGGYVTQANGAGAYYKKCTNHNSVSIELCDIVSKNPSAKMIKAVKKVIKYIRYKCPYAKTVLRHFDVSGKSCPERMASMSGEKYERWQNFLEDIGEVKSYPTANLNYGDKGEQVKRLQRCLNKIMGTHLTIDGSYGGQTLKVVLKFKRKYGLANTDKVGPKTRKKIKSLIK